MSEGGQKLLEIDDIKPYLNKSWIDFWQGDDYKAAQKAINRAVKGKPGTFQGYCPTAKGTPKWWDVSITPILNITGKADKLLSVSRDVTQYKQAEQELKDSKYFLENVLKTTPSGIFTINTEKTITSWNRMAEQITGYNEGDAIGTKCSFLLADTCATKCRLFDDTIKKPGMNTECTIRVKSGKTITLMKNFDLLFGKSGEVVGGIESFIDISEKKRTEQIQKILYNISFAVQSSECLEDLIRIIQKQIGTVIDTTNFFVVLYDQETDTISLPYHSDKKDQVSPFPVGNALTAHVIKTHQPLLATKQVISKLSQSGDIEILGSKSAIWLGVPMMLKGKVTGVIAIYSYEDENAFNIHDLEILEFISTGISISIERKKSEDELKEALEKAFESDRLKSAFLATMSHELRTPLNAVIGFSQLMDAETPPDEVVMMTQRINKSGLHLLSIIEEMFDVTLIESGQVTVKEEEFYILPFMEHMHKMLKTEQRSTNKEGIEIVVNGKSQKRDLLICTDKFKLNQILINLLKNALKFTHSGQIEYGYKQVIHDDEPFLQFFVKDSGIGIPEESQGIIFDIFRQADDSHTRQYGGTGIGLSVAKKLTEILGGKIWLDSKEGEGSTFYFTIPYQGQKTILPSQSSKASPQGEASFPGKTILIVEDDGFSFEFLQLVLEGLQIKILYAKNGLEAIELSGSNPEIDLVLMDIKMPGMSGYEATEQIKKTRPALPVIAQTAYALYGDMEKSEEAGCDDYITKPIQKEALLKILEKHLNQ